MRILRICIFLILICGMFTLSCFSAEQVYITGYTLSTPTWTRDYNTDQIPNADLTITITDNRISPVTDFSEAYVTITPHNGIFTSEPVHCKLSSTTYSITLYNISYHGGDPVFSFDLSYTGLSKSISSPGPTASLPEDTNNTYTTIHTDPNSVIESYTLPTITLSQLIGQCRTIEKIETPPVEVNYRTPHIQVYSLNYAQTNPTNGTGQLEITFSTTTGNENLIDVWIQLTFPDGIEPMDGKTKYFIGTLKPENTKEITIPLQIEQSTTTSQLDVPLSIIGCGENSGTEITSSEIAKIKLEIADRFTCLNLSTPTRTYINTETLVTAECVNKGRQPIYNLTSTLYGASDTPLDSQYIGNVECGQVITTALSFIPHNTGEFVGFLELTYESESGESNVLRKQIAITIDTPAYISPTENTLANIYELTQRVDSKKPPLWCWFILITICIIAAVRLILGWLRQFFEYRKYLSRDD